MKQLPLPVRLAAGLAVTAVEQARKLPGQLAGLPVTVVSEALQLSMRVQQTVTELAIRGDDVLAGLRTVEQEPEWAVFDEDEADAPPRTAPSAAPAAKTPSEQERRSAAEGIAKVAAATGAADPADSNADDDQGDDSGDPWAREERALAAESPTALPEYDSMSLPQLRAKLRSLSEDDLEQLLAHERAHESRPEFTGMLARRLANLRAES
ncbi:lipid droplet-associated protein [Actinosynnema mirum]|uniref:DUF8129 domain-containing protein n=1 Tax=Actinosynnema mirum (strain ATCC 29888 / DSM 43827 / JCM 3225 / NBRC 14064 / NCIMB 13271 / NRRL B-12336 / IMRU 3971 / 101) TaxID=446462 RepID=C6WKT6_ACTMD|nr:lipid droplet-associated protein [Actinosynnema mirum]ACU34691.1 hypothetical protein Amir_0728 [Actinosynnema mirum DSM 43827]